MMPKYINAALQTNAKAWTFDAKAWTFEARAWTFEAKAIKFGLEDYITHQAHAWDRQTDRQMGSNA